MKIRTDFVTNSSSSSFCSIRVSSTKLKEILEKHKNVFKNSYLIKCGASISKDGFEYQSEGDMWNVDGPENESELAWSLINFIDDLCDDFDKDEKIDEMLLELAKNDEAIKDSITSLSWEYRNLGWGSDDESRFDIERYDEDYITEYLHLKGKNELTKEIKEQFLEKVGNKTSLERKRWEYDGKKLVVLKKFEIID